MFINSKSHYRKNTDRMEIFDANVLIQLIADEKIVAVSAETTRPLHVCHKMSIAKFKHKMQTCNFQSQSSQLRSLGRTETNVKTVMNCQSVIMSVS